MSREHLSRLPGVLHAVIPGEGPRIGFENYGRRQFILPHGRYLSNFHAAVQVVHPTGQESVLINGKPQFQIVAFPADRVLEFDCPVGLLSTPGPQYVGLGAGYGSDAADVIGTAKTGDVPEACANRWAVGLGGPHEIKRVAVGPDPATGVIRGVGAPVRTGKGIGMPKSEHMAKLVGEDAVGQ